MLACFDSYDLDLFIRPEWQNLEAGTKVIYVNRETLEKYELEAPAEEGKYNLYEQVDSDKNHFGWMWVKARILNPCFFCAEISIIYLKVYYTKYFIPKV